MGDCGKSRQQAVEMTSLAKPSLLGRFRVLCLAIGLAWAVPCAIWIHSRLTEPGKATIVANALRSVCIEIAVFRTANGRWPSGQMEWDQVRQYGLMRFKQFPIDAHIECDGVGCKVVVFGKYSAFGNRFRVGISIDDNDLDSQNWRKKIPPPWDPGYGLTVSGKLGGPE